MMTEKMLSMYHAKSYREENSRFAHKHHTHAKHTSTHMCEKK